jgi:hypothetical protein
VTTLKAGKDASMTAHYRGVSITDNIAPPIVVGFSNMTNDTTTCDACGTRYVFTSYKDRCPVCCPEQKREDDEPDGYEQADWKNDDDVSVKQKRRPEGRRSINTRLILFMSSSYASSYTAIFVPMQYFQ